MLRNWILRRFIKVDSMKLTEDWNFSLHDFYLIFLTKLIFSMRQQFIEKKEIW